VQFEFSWIINVVYFEVKIDASYVFFYVSDEKEFVPSDCRRCYAKELVLCSEKGCMSSS
jgi:hypothetical protein